MFAGEMVKRSASGIKAARSKMRRSRGIRRRGPVALTDTRSPLVRLLQDGMTPQGMVVVSYEQQWRTLSKAQRDGYLDDDQRLTDKGRALLQAERSEAAPTPLSE